MVRAILGFFYQETEKLHQAAFLLAFFSILSQILAFFRDRGLAHLFGAGESLDIYYAAFRIPDLIFVTVASMVSLSVLVPFILERDKEGREKVREFIDDIFSFFSVVIVVVSFLAFFLMPKVVPILFKGFGPDALAQVVLVSRILLLSPVLLGFSNLLASLTQAYNRFLVYAFAPVLYNLGIILGIVFIAPRFGVIGVAFGVALGSLMHLAIQVPSVIKIDLLPRIKLFFDFNNIKRVVALSLPRTLTLSTAHIATLFLLALASLMTVGSISVYSLAQNISSVPLSIIGVSYSLAAFPTLSRYFSSNDIKAFVDQMSTTIRHIIFWSLPAIALFIVLRAQVVRVLLGSGNFDWSDTRLTAAALAIFALSVLSQSLLLLFIRAFYSAGHTLKPLLMNLLSTLVIVLSSYVLVKMFYLYPSWGEFLARLLKVDDVTGTVVLMLPLGFSIGTIFNSVIHWLSFEKDFGRFDRATYSTLVVSLIGAFFVGVSSYFGLNVFAQVFDLTSLLGIFLQGLLAGLLGIFVGVVVLYLLKSKELREIFDALRHKFKGIEPIAENAEIV